MVKEGRSFDSSLRSSLRISPAGIPLRSRRVSGSRWGTRRLYGSCHAEGSHVGNSECDLFGVFFAVIDGKCKQNAVAVGSEEAIHAALRHVIHVSRVQSVSRIFDCQPPVGDVSSRPNRKIRCCFINACSNPRLGLTMRE